jgi:hypothetical protein
VLCSSQHVIGRRLIELFAKASLFLLVNRKEILVILRTIILAHQGFTTLLPLVCDLPMLLNSSRMRLK